MTFFDLKKRLAAKRAGPTRPELAVAPTTLAAASLPAPVPPAEVAASVSGLAPADDPLVTVGPLEAAPPVDWDPEVLGTLAATLPPGQDVLLLGLGPWGHTGGRSLPEALLGRTRFLVALDPERARLAAVRGYCQRTLEASVSEIADPEIVRRLGGPRFGVVVVSDALVRSPDPLGLLRLVRGLLAPEGRLLVVVPNQAHADVRLALLAGELPREAALGAPLHHYTRERLRELFAFTGYALENLTAFERAPLGSASGLVPELFAPAVLEALGPADDARAAYYVALGVQAPASRLLRELFDEQETLRKVVRNELAVAARSHEELTRALKEALYTRDQALADAEEAKRKETGLNELVARAEQNVRRLGKEVDDAQRELAHVKAGFWYRLGQLFKKPAQRPLEFAVSGVDRWKPDPPQQGL